MPKHAIPFIHTERIRIIFAINPWTMGPKFLDRSVPSSADRRELDFYHKQSRMVNKLRGSLTRKGDSVSSKARKDPLIGSEERRIEGEARWRGGSVFTVKVIQPGRVSTSTFQRSPRAVGRPSSPRALQFQGRDTRWCRKFPEDFRRSSEIVRRGRVQKCFEGRETGRKCRSRVQDDRE